MNKSVTLITYAKIEMLPKRWVRFCMHHGNNILNALCLPSSGNCLEAPEFVFSSCLLSGHQPFLAGKDQVDMFTYTVCPGKVENTNFRYELLKFISKIGIG